MLVGKAQENLLSLGDIHLERIDSSNWRQALEIRTASGQLEFVADHEPVALVMLSKSYVRPGGLTWEPFGIRSGGAMVGIVALAHSGSTCEIYHLLIDHSRQGEGIGAGAVQAILDHVIRELPSCNELTLTVHPRNERAQRLYRSTGFRSTGAHQDGEPVWQLELER